MKRATGLCALVCACASISLWSAPARAQAPAAASSAPFAAPPAGVVRPYPAPATIPFVATDPLPLVAASVNGHPAFFFIDTGAPDLVLDPDFATEAGITLTAAGTGTFAGGKHAAIARGVADHVSVGPVAIDGVPVTSLPTHRIQFFPGHRVDGIIGTLFLARFLATIDYVHGALILRPRSASTAFEAAAAASGATIVPITVLPDHFIFARGRINDGPEGLFSVDTGLAGGGVAPSKDAVADSHIQLDEKNAGQGMGAAGPVRVVPFTASVTLGTRRVDGVTGLFTPDGDPYGIFPFPVRGTVSHGYFRTCALTFDFDAMKLVMQ